MKLSLYELLDVIGFVELYISEMLDNGKERDLIIGYPEEIKEYLELCNSTTRYEVVHFDSIKNEMLTLTVVEV